MYDRWLTNQDIPFIAVIWEGVLSFHCKVALVFGVQFLGSSEVIFVDHITVALVTAKEPPRYMWVSPIYINCNHHSKQFQLILINSNRSAEP